MLQVEQADAKNDDDITGSVLELVANLMLARPEDHSRDCPIRASVTSLMRRSGVGLPMRTSANGRARKPPSRIPTTRFQHYRSSCSAWRCARRSGR